MLDLCQLAQLTWGMDFMNADAQSEFRVGTWILISRPGGNDFVGFTYVDPAKGLCVKGGPLDRPDFGTRPSETYHSLPWHDLRWRYLSIDEIRQLRLPDLPDWVRLYGPQPHPGITWDPLLDDQPQVSRPAAGSVGLAQRPRTPPYVNLWSIGDDIDGLFHVEQILGGPGQSGMGTVYVGHSSLIGDVCAVKTLQDQLLYDAAVHARFRQESLTWIRLGAHDNIVQAYSWQVLDGRPCLFMEYVDGGDLSQWIGAPALFDHPELVLRFAIDFCTGMIHATAQGLHVHRDVKPQNCLISSGERPVLKVADFGLAKALDDSSAGRSGAPGDPRLLNVHATQYGQAVGTCTHMAPEQFADARRVDVRADVYAFGVMLFQMVTGRLPFQGRTWQDFHRLHATAPPPSLPRGSVSELSALIKICLAKDPADRFPGFSAVRDQLGAIYRLRVGDFPLPEGRERRLSRHQLSQKGTSLGLLGQAGEALLVHDQVIAENPDDAGSDWIGKVHALRATGRYEEALACCAEVAVSRLPTLRGSNAALWWSLWVAKGEVLWALERLEDALACFDSALEIDPTIDIGWSRKAGVLSLLKRYSESADCYGRLVELAPNDSDYWLQRGEALRKAGRPGEAIPAFDRAIALKQESFQAWANRGLALAAHGDQRDEQTMQQALYSMDQAIAINPAHPETWFIKASLLISYQRPRDALACFAEARRLGHSSAAVMIEAVQSKMAEPPPSGGAR
jgi:serine/threonine protein kinase/Tfp pilus assembly protein PilF